MAGSLGVAGNCVVRKGGDILLLRRSSASSCDAGRWELPGGKLDYGEELTETVRREVAEETGLTVEAERPFAVWHGTKDEFWVTGVTFTCNYVAGAVRLSAEHDDHVWVDPFAAVDLPLREAMVSQIESYARLLREGRI
jgi:8-oxo-dGTP pyrophosphatase MutT (NUDIX family)